MAARGVGEVSRALVPSKDARGQVGETGVFHQRHLHPVFGQMRPVIELLEVQQPRRFFSNVLKNIAVPAAERSFVSGYEALLRGALRDALERFSDAFTKDAQFADAYFMHGAISLELEAYESAVHSFKKVLLCQARLGTKIRKYVPSLRLTLCLTENSSFAFYPDLLGVSILLSLAHRGLRDDEEAGTVLDQLLGVLPDNPVVGFFLSLHYIEAGRWRDVIALLKDTLPDDNISLCNLILLARACVETHDAETALEIFKKILTRTDFDPQLMLDARYGYGTALANRGRNTEAEDEFNRITSRYPGFLDLLERLGIEAGARRPSAIPAPGSRAAGSIPVVAVPEFPVSSPSAREPEPLPEAVPVEPSPLSAAQAVPSTSSTAPVEPAARPTALIPAPPATAAASGASAAALLMLVTDDATVSHSLESGETVIGREEGDIVISHDSAASRRHASVRVERGEAWLEDLSSTNGTYVNGHRIGGRVLLNRGDVVTVGQTRFNVR